MEALRGDASSEDIEKLMDELQRAMDKYLASLAERLKNLGATVPPRDMGLRYMGSDELQRLIQEARQLARTGAREAAQRLLAEMQRLLDSIRAGLESGGRAADAEKARRLMDGLRNMTKEQRELLDRTYRRMRQGPGAMTLPRQPGRPGQPRQPRGPGGQQPGMGKDAAQQEALRHRLGDLMLHLDEFLGGIPQPLGKAERAMRDAADALTLGRPGDAVPAQSEALEQLRRATESAGEQMARRLGGLTLGPGRPTGGKGRDPFGRRPGGAFGAAINGDVAIPDQAEIQRAREILDELRRRAGDLTRPKIEHQYIDRLLRQF